MKYLTVVVLSLVLVGCTDSGKGKSKVSFTKGLVNGASIESDSLIDNAWCNTDEYYTESDKLVETLTSYDFREDGSLTAEMTTNGKKKRDSASWSYDGTYLKIKVKSKVIKSRVEITDSELTLIGNVEVHYEDGEVEFEDTVYSVCE